MGDIYLLPAKTFTVEFSKIIQLSRHFISLKINHLAVEIRVLENDAVYFGGKTENHVPAILDVANNI